MSERKTTDVWVAWTNTDRIEGRGRDVPLAVCETEATAIRLGRGQYVQGSNCPVTKEEAVSPIGITRHYWLVPGTIEPPSTKDVKQQRAIDEREAAKQRALDAGLSEEDIKLLGGLAR